MSSHIANRSQSSCADIFKVLKGWRRWCEAHLWHLVVFNRERSSVISAASHRHPPGLRNRLLIELKSNDLSRVPTGSHHPKLPARVTDVLSVLTPQTRPPELKPKGSSSKSNQTTMRRSPHPFAASDAPAGSMARPRRRTDE